MFVPQAGASPRISLLQQRIASLSSYETGKRPMPDAKRSPGPGTMQGKNTADTRTPAMPAAPNTLQERIKRQHASRYPSSRRESLAAALQLRSPEDADAMMHAWPPLTNFNHEGLADKLTEMARLLQLQPQQLSQALVARPKVFDSSLGEFESRVEELCRLFGSLDCVSQLVLQEPALLSWSPRHLRRRLAAIAANLGLAREELLQLLEQHPALLPASGHLLQSLRLLQQMLQLAAGAEPVGGLGGGAQVLQQQQQQQPQLGQWQNAPLPDEQQQYQTIQDLQPWQQQQQQQAWPQPSPMQQRVTFQQQPQPQQTELLQGHYQQQQQQQDQQQICPLAEQQSIGRQRHVPITTVRAFALEHLHLLLVPPVKLASQFTLMQAQSGLSAAEVAAVVAANPQLLLLEQAEDTGQAQQHRNQKQEQQKQQSRKKKQRQKQKRQKRHNVQQQQQQAQERKQGQQRRQQVN